MTFQTILLWVKKNRSNHSQYLYWPSSSFTAWSWVFYRGQSSMYLGSSHRGPRWECFVLCLRSFGIALSTCRPAVDLNQKDMWTISDVEHILIFFFLNADWLKENLHSWLCTDLHTETICQFVPLPLGNTSVFLILTLTHFEFRRLILM